MIDQELLKILACPLTKKSLEPAADDLIKRLNQAIEAGGIHNKAMEKVAEPVDGGLQRQGDPSAIYPVRKNIPVLIVDELISLDQLNKE